jgi:hypothetical protein
MEPAPERRVTEIATMLKRAIRLASLIRMTIDLAARDSYHSGSVWRRRVRDLVKVSDEPRSRQSGLSGANKNGRETVC